MSATEQPLAPAVPSAPAGVDGAGPSTSEPAAKPGGRGRGRGRGRGPGRGRGRGRGRGAAADKKGKAPADGGDEDDKEDANPAPEIDQKKRKRGILTRDLKYMMYGFGDTQQPDPETVDLLEDMTVDYLTNFAHRCMEVSARRGKLQTEDLLYLIRDDEKKMQRVNELLDMNMQLKEARKNFDTDEAAIER